MPIQAHHSISSATIALKPLPQERITPTFAKQRLADRPHSRNTLPLASNPLGSGKHEVVARHQDPMPRWLRGQIHHAILAHECRNRLDDFVRSFHQTPT